MKLKYGLGRKSHVKWFLLVSHLIAFCTPSPSSPRHGDFYTRSIEKREKDRKFDLQKIFVASTVFVCPVKYESQI